MKTFKQSSPYETPWTLSIRIRLLAWTYVWAILCAWTPKPLNHWRLFWIKVFGAKIYGHPFVHQRARIQFPWNLILHDRACLGDGTVAYSLGEIEVHEHATVAQEAYLCTGTHDFSVAARPLQVSKISIGPHAFIGARAFVMPGVHIGRYAIVGAGSVVTRSVPDHCVVAGNPARLLKKMSTNEN